MELKLKYLGEDRSGRPVYEDTKGTIFKNTDLGGEPTVYNLYTSDRFDGEPDLPIKKDFKIVVIED